MAYDGGKHSSWTLRKTLGRKAETHKTFNIAVIGLSGTEKDKGCHGSGKSCLCNRFVRPFADDYYTDHISVLSQSDFNGRIVNNDHWLYWGEVSKITEDGVELHFSIIEHTEFIDDACLQPFKTAKTEPYFKRCSSTRLSSGDKLMYICKNQLGIEKEFEERVLPEGRFLVDGFVCVFDVSQVQGRSFERSIEQTILILNNLIKTKKPIVLATTKNDEACDLFIREAEKLVNRKDYRGSIPLIETSAHENVNVDLAFVLCAQLHDRSKGRAKIIPYYEAVRYRKEALDYASDSYQALLRLNINDYHVVWHSVCKSLAIYPEFLTYCDLFGQDAAHLMFKRHVKRLRDETINRKLQVYLQVFPDVFSELLPELESLLPHISWEEVKDRLRSHPDYNQYFIDNPSHLEWYEMDLLASGETRIPWGLLQTPEAESCFIEYARELEGEDRRRELRQQFKQQLAETGFVTPGKLLNEVRVFFMGREAYESLTEQDLQEVYEEYQREITEVAKKHFQELLLEHSEIFYHFASFGPGSVITQEDILKITQILSHDLRFTCLERLEQDRMLMLLRHLGFIHGPIREHCSSYPNCIDVLIEKVLPSGCRLSSNGHASSKKQKWESVSEASLSIVILGSNGLGQDLARVLQAVNRKLSVNGIHYALDLRVIDGDIDLAHHSFTTNDFVPQGCLCIYSNHQTLEYVTDSVEKTLLSNLEAEEDRLPFLGLPLSILYAAEVDASDKDRAVLCEEGENRARSLQCPFYDVTFGTNDSKASSSASLGSSDSPPNDNMIQHLFREDGIKRALVSLIDCFQQKSASNPMNVLTAKTSHHHLHHQSSSSMRMHQPDLRLLVCFLCGDPFELVHVMRPFFQERSCTMTAVNSLAVEVIVSLDNEDGEQQGSKSRSSSRSTNSSSKVIELILTSYHGAQAFRDELLHGFILVFSTQRKASLATLAAFSRNIPNTPTQMIGITDGVHNIIYGSSDELAQELISEAESLADRIRAHLITTSTDNLKIPMMDDFFRDALDRKPQIEAAFDLDESETSLNPDQGLAHSSSSLTKIPPPIPSRQESYDMAAGFRKSDEDDYEELPDADVIDRRSPVDIPRPTPRNSARNKAGQSTSANIVPRHVYRDPPYSAVDGDVDRSGHERLVKPSQVKIQRSLQSGKDHFNV